MRFGACGRGRGRTARGDTGAVRLSNKDGLVLVRHMRQVVDGDEDFPCAERSVGGRKIVLREDRQINEERGADAEQSMQQSEQVLRSRILPPGLIISSLMRVRLVFPSPFPYLSVFPSHCSRDTYSPSV